MSRLMIVTQNNAQKTVEGLYKDMERRIQASQPGLCPVDLAEAFLHVCHAQSCGKCVPCRVGLGQLAALIESVLNGSAEEKTIETIEKTAESIYHSADCAIGFEAAKMVLRGVRGFREDYEEHVRRGRCLAKLSQPVPCVALCPAHVDVPGYVALIHEGRCEDAVRLIRKDNPFPAACGLICEHPCELRCRRTMLDKASNIRGLKRFAVEREGEIPVPKRMPLSGKRIAVVGGGPSGLSAAYYLSIMGHEVTVYEQRKQLGGMLRYGIPAYRLPREILDREIEGLKKSGFQTITDISVGHDIGIEELRRDFDAVYVAIGAHTDRKIGVEGEDAGGVISAVEMLREIGDDHYPDFSGMNIVVVGGGNVAMDVARSAIRLGARSVKIAYRRRRVDMTALPEEVEGAIADGCEILELNSPVRIEKDEKGHCKALIVKPQIIGPVRYGRPSPKDSEAAEESIAADRVLVAIGQGIDFRKFAEYSGIKIEQGRISALDTSEIEDAKGIFAGGDCVTGPATVIRAIAAGKTAAANIDDYLGYHHEIQSDVTLPPVRFDDNAPTGRINMRERAAEERVKDFKLMECGMTEEEACQESGRCLHCDHFGYGIFRGGREEKW